LSRAAWSTQNKEERDAEASATGGDREKKVRKEGGRMLSSVLAKKDLGDSEKSEASGQKVNGKKGGGGVKKKKKKTPKKKKTFVKFLWGLKHERVLEGARTKKKLKRVVGASSGISKKVNPVLEMQHNSVWVKDTGTEISGVL